MLKTGSSFYATSPSVLEMVEPIVKGKKRILPCASYLNGEFGYDGIYMGVPTKFRKNGVEKCLS